MMKPGSLVFLCMLCVAVPLLQAQAGPGVNVTLSTEFQDVPPKFILDAQGKPSGISFELMRLIEANSWVRFTWSTALVPLARASHDLEIGWVDVQVGLQKTAEREKVMVFGEPLYVVRTTALINKDDTADFASIKDLIRLGSDRGLILSIYGTGISLILEKIPGIYLDNGAQSLEMGLQKLEARRGRVLIYHNLSINYLLETPAFKGKFKKVPMDFSDYPLLADSAQFIVFSKKVPGETVSYINQVIQKLRANGELKKITGRYVD